MTELAFPVDVKPDISNQTKAIEEALEKAGVVENDSRISGLGVFKWYVPKGDEPFIDIRVYELRFSKSAR